MNEAKTCRTLVRPKLEESCWDGNRHFYSEQTYFTDGRIIVIAGKPRRFKGKYSDFLLRYTRDITLAIVIAKSHISLVEAALRSRSSFCADSSYE